jgi:hypothetical protein
MLKPMLRVAPPPRSDQFNSLVTTLQRLFSKAGLGRQAHACKGWTGLLYYVHIVCEMRRFRDLRFTITVSRKYGHLVLLQMQTHLHCRARLRR